MCDFDGRVQPHPQEYKTKPEIVRELAAAYERFAESVNLIEVPDDFDQREVQGWRLDEDVVELLGVTR